jgi:hypothetical protein
MKKFFCSTSYSATCEGWVVYLSVEYAETPEDAKNKHSQRFKFDDFYKIGIKVLDTKLPENEKRINEILSSFFNKDFIKFLSAKNYYKPFRKGELFDCIGDDFSFSFYVNRS